MHTLATALRERLGLQLFNFDLICPEQDTALGEGGGAAASAALGGTSGTDVCSTSGTGGAEELYYVIDINYFPGVDKIPNFEDAFVDFLLEACTGMGGQSGDQDHLMGQLLANGSAAHPAGEQL